jgi:hypothetical protein
MRNKSGKPLTSGGTTIVKTYISNAIGTDNSQINIERTNINYYEAIILTSDSFLYAN